MVLYLSVIRILKKVYKMKWGRIASFICKLNNDSKHMKGVSKECFLNVVSSESNKVQ